MLRAGAADFRPGTRDSYAGTVTEHMLLPSALADGNSTEFVSKEVYHRLLLQNNALEAEVCYLRQQFVELTSKFADLDSWKSQTNSSMRSLRDQHRAIQRRVDDKIFVPKEVPTLEEKTCVMESPPNKICVWHPSVSVTDEEVAISQGFDPEGLKVYKSLFESFDTTKVEWNIRNFSTKLKAGMGRPLVSAPFTLWEFEEVRLMVAPCMPEGSTGPRSRREKEQFSKNVSEGPCHASLMLKIPNARPCKLRYCLGVGKEKTGPHECDFSHTAIDNRGSFGINWLSELEKDLSITVSVEMLPPPEVHHRAPPGLPPPTEATAVRSGTNVDLGVGANASAATQDQVAATSPGSHPSAPPGLPPPMEAIDKRGSEH